MSEPLRWNKNPDFSKEFCRHHADRFAEVSRQLLYSVYVKSSHPALKGDYNLLEQQKELTPRPPGAVPRLAMCTSSRLMATTSMGFMLWRRTFGVQENFTPKLPIEFPWTTCAIP